MNRESIRCFNEIYTAILAQDLPKIETLLQSVQKDASNRFLFGTMIYYMLAMDYDVQTISELLERTISDTSFRKDLYGLILQIVCKEYPRDIALKHVLWMLQYDIITDESIDMLIECSVGYESFNEIFKVQGTERVRWLCACFDCIHERHLSDKNFFKCTCSVKLAALMCDEDVRSARMKEYRELMESVF